MSEVQKKLTKLTLLEKKKELKDGLPHLYGFKWYKWAKEFFESTNKDNYLCAANQISKSSTQIRKCIDWATNKKRWPSLWKRRPLTFWYLYPTKSVATIEFKKKWVPEFLPRDKYKNSEEFGWREEFKAGDILAIHFRSGVSVYFKTYATDVQNLQTGTCDAIFADEELPVELYDELNLRRAATDGYFHMVFTATLGQNFWREVIEGRGSQERFPDAAKWQVSAYDCMHYVDGSPSDWTEERINRVKNSCKSEAEIQRRVMGRFVIDEGLKFPSFVRSKNVKPHHHLPSDWHVYVGIDIGSGGEDNHPAAITFVGVSPDFTKGRVFKGWRGDGIETDASDVLKKYIEMKIGITVTAAYYDYSSKEFGITATRNNIPVLAADKTHETGERIVNILFKNDMLAIYDLPELEPLMTELETLKASTKKTRAKDDYVDSLRYAISSVPWDWSVISGEKVIDTKEVRTYTTDELRRAQPIEEVNELLIESEFEEWNDLYG